MSSSLLNPAFSVEWPMNSKEITDKVFHLLEKCCSPIRVSDKTGKRRLNPKKDREIIAGKKDDISGQSTSILKEDDSVDKLCEQSNLPSSSAKTHIEKSTKLDFKEFGVLGISSILRRMEQKTFSIILFDRQLLQPSAIAQFIGSGCIASGAHCVSFDGLSDRISPILNVKSAAVLGIKRLEKYPELVGELLDFVKSSTRPVVFRTQDESNICGLKKEKQRKMGSLVGQKRNSTIPFVDATVTMSHGKKKRKK